MNRKTLGQRGENIARHYYQKLGWQVIAKNYWTRCGELDLVLKKNRQILVVEVKTRTSENFGWAEESINQKKLNNIYQAYEQLHRAKGLNSNYQLEICVIQIAKKQISLRRLLL